VSSRVGLVLVALAAAAALGGAAPAAAGVPGAREVSALLRGTPQQGAWLGRPTAPVTLVEYVDLQCPFCAKFAAETFRPIVRRYVKTGRVRVLFRGIAFLGADSVSTLRWTYAAGRQNKLWNLLELLFANQGGENSGWAKPRLLADVARSVPGLDLARLRRDVPRTTSQLKAATAAAAAAKVPGTPYLEIGGSLTTLRPLPLKSFDPDDIAQEIDRLLRR
jgi:protein-disulfide isomerase